MREATISFDISKNNKNRERKIANRSTARHLDAALWITSLKPSSFNSGGSYGAGDVSGATRRSRLERDRGDRMDHDYGEEEHGVDYGSASRRRQQQDSRALNAI